MNDISFSIRPYVDADKESVLNLLRLNTPTWFAKSEEKDFVSYLDSQRELYYVVLVDREIVGCGGINFSDCKTIGKLSWDMFHPDYQGKSLGSELVKYRINKLQSMENIQEISVRTSQFAYQFYKKQGFKLIETKLDYWAKGYDLYFMKYL